MLVLTLQVALSTLSFIYKSPVILPKIETIKEFDNAWKTNFNLVVAMSKDNRIAESLNAADWKKLQDVSSYLDRNESPLILFSVLEEILEDRTVEAIVKTYPEYPVALAATKELAITITEDFRLLDMTQENWKQLLAITRMETAPKKNLEFHNTTDCTALCDNEINEKGTYLKLVNTDLIEMRNTFHDVIPTTTESAIAFLQMGFLLKEPFLSNTCSKFLEKALSMENVVSIFKAAGRTEMKDLKSKAEDYIFWEFEDISKKDKNFVSLKVEELFSLLMSGKIYVPNEISVFEAIQRWTMAELTTRKEHVVTLMRAVRLHLCSDSQLNTMLDHHLLAGLNSIQQSIRSVIYLIQMDSPKLPALIKKEQRHLPETLFVIGGALTGQSSITVETFSPSKKQWIYQQSLNNGTQGMTSAVVVGQTIIVFDHDRYSVSSFDPVKKEWKFLSTVPNGRRYFAVSELNGEIYVLGGQTGSYSNICERFNPKTGIWTEIPYLNTPSEYPAAATLQGNIYLAGGRYGSTYHNTFQLFDPERNRWEVLTPLNYARGFLALVTEGNNLWALGGYTGRLLNYVEKYEPVSGTWIIMPALPSARDELGAVFLSGNLFVLGSSDAASRSTVDVYNPRWNTWARSFNLHFGRSRFSACVVKDLPNAYDYT